MKKFLLTLAAVGAAFAMNATSYTLFDIDNAGDWKGDEQGFGQIVKFGDKQFTVVTDKAKSTTALIAPNSNSYAWRVYKSSDVIVKAEGVSMKKVVITYDDYESGKYCLEMTLSNGWTGTLAAPEYTLSAAGLDNLTMSATNGQVRIKKIVVSDTDEISDPQTPTAQEGYAPNGTTPDDPELPEGVIYQNSFDSNLEGWEKINDESLSDFSGWKINSNTPKCAICNSYYGGTNHAANAKMQYTFDLKDWSNVSLSFIMGFGYDFPQAQNDNYRVYVISNGVTEYLTMANFPPAPATGNWTASADWATNTFDLSEYDGTALTIGFEYATDGSISRAWELKDFVLSGEKSGAGVNGIVNEEAAPVYYNLQGVRVANPENGLFIVVKGSKTSKVIF